MGILKNHYEITSGKCRAHVTCLSRLGMKKVPRSPDARTEFEENVRPGFASDMLSVVSMCVILSFFSFGVMGSLVQIRRATLHQREDRDRSSECHL